MNKSFKSLMHSAVAFIILLNITACLDDTSSSPNADTNANADKDNTNTETGETMAEINLTPVFNQFEFNKPLAMYQSENLQWFVVEQAGLIKTFNSNDNSLKTFIDLRAKVKFDGEMGLLGMALHPKFKVNGLFFASYTGNDNTSYISRFQSDNLLADEQSETIILSVPQPYSNHNGGQISFGPDGFLYIGFGDGGSSGDPLKHAQNKDTLLGALLRIDVNNENAKPYTIPTDNPFVNAEGKDEIYAYGLRNPWRWSFDKLTKELWLADVGQIKREEINLIQKGGNYGWNIMEGTQCYLEENCLSSDFISPIFDYSRVEGQSVTGGYVYRGGKNLSLTGVYLYADYVSGKIWGLKKSDDNKYTNNLLIDSSVFISSFAEDQTGNLYILGHQSGKIFAITEKL